jgi:23S rRNA pseudouridine1911/1915/1917 synthase
LHAGSLEKGGLVTPALPHPGVEILYEDNHLLSLNKPAGLLTQPSGLAADNLEDRAKSYLKETRNKPGNVFLHAVHRLDKVASGVALFASTGKALTRMNEQMRSRYITRIYHAVVAGELPGTKGELVHFLRHSRLRSVEASEHDPGSRKAVLRYRLLARSGGLSLLEINLETGRYHQIRAQLASTGCPIIGDEAYGSEVIYPGDGIALHHRRMEFLHPVSKAPVSLEAGYPPQWPVFP